MRTSAFALLLLSALPIGLSDIPPVSVPWSGRSIADFHTYVLTDRLGRNGKDRTGAIGDYAKMQGDWIALTFNDESIFKHNPDMRLLRSDLVQFFSMPAGGKLFFRASIKRDKPVLKNARTYQLFFTELKMFEVHLDASNPSSPRWIFRVQGEPRWSLPMDLGKRYNFGILCDGGRGTVSLYFSEGDGDLQLSSASDIKAVVEARPQVHWGPLIWQEGGATLQGSETFLYRGVEVTDEADLRVSRGGYTRGGGAGRLRSPESLG